MRLVTRADFDGLVCGALITKFENIDSYLFVEPKFMHVGLVEVRNGDIIANLPFRRNSTAPSCRAKAVFASHPAPHASFANITLKHLSRTILTQRHDWHS